jgi:hypothetical protein
MRSIRNRGIAGAVPRIHIGPQPIGCTIQEIFNVRTLGLILIFSIYEKPAAAQQLCLVVAGMDRIQMVANKYGE